MPTLATDAAREAAGSPLRASFTAGFRRMTEFVTGLVPTRRSDRRRERALASIAAQVGALTLARPPDDDELASELLAAVQVHLSSAH